jgi:hypothetical protein
LCPSKDGFETKLVNDKCTYIDKGIITEEQSKSIEDPKIVLPEEILEDKDIQSSATYVKPLVEEEYIVRTDSGAVIITKT